MALKLKISYEHEGELPLVLALLKPILDGAKIKKEPSQGRYKRIYITPRNLQKPTK